MKTGWHNLQYLFSDGRVLYLNHFFALIAILALIFYFCAVINKKKFDKALHVSISAILTGVFFWVFNLLDWYWWIGPIVVFLIGFFKEVADRLNKKKRLFDPYDLVADTVGVASITLAYLFSWVLYVEM